MRLLYSALLIFLLPFIFLRLAWRGRRESGYRRFWGQRLGFGNSPSTHGACSSQRHALSDAASGRIWIHAVSLGETRAAEPLIVALLARYPSHVVLISHMTATGRATGEALAARYPGRVEVTWLPYDLPGAMARFIDAWQPNLALIMETEIWPNLMRGLALRSIPTVLINARLSERSSRGYARLDALVRPAFAAFTAVLAQTDQDAKRLQQRGAQGVCVTGNLKFDHPPASDALALGQRWRRAMGQRAVLVAASTRDGEEALILAAWKKKARQGALLVIVPRHPQRFDAVAQLIAAQGFALARRSCEPPSERVEVWLGDSLGEMSAYYALADLAFVGGSLLPLGGQNLIEAAACACPILIGQHTFNFAQASADAVACGAAIRVANADELVQTANECWAQPERMVQQRAAAQAFARAHQGALERTLIQLEPWLTSRVSSCG